MSLNLDTFGELMNDFIRENEIRMLIELPKGTNEAVVTCTDVHTIDFYVLLQAVCPVFVSVIDDMGGPEEVDAEGVLDGMWEIIRQDCLEKLREEREHVRDTNASAVGHGGGEEADV